MHSLSQVAFFKGVDDLDFTRFERRCVWRKFRKGQTIIEFEDDSRDVYFLLSGVVRAQVRTPGGKAFTLADLRQGECFGELSAIDEEPRSANVTALTNSVICIVEASILKEMLAASPLLARKMMQLLAGRIRALNTRFFEQTVLDIRHRLYADLLRLSVPRPSAPPERVVSPPPFQHELAARIGCRREQITRELGAMEKDGLLRKTRGGLVLANPDAMRSRVSQKLQEAG